MSFWTWIIVCIPLAAGIIAANSGKKKKDRSKWTEVGKRRLFI